MSENQKGVRIEPAQLRHRLLARGHTTARTNPAAPQQFRQAGPVVASVVGEKAGAHGRSLGLIHARKV